MLLLVMCSKVKGILVVFLPKVDHDFFLKGKNVLTAKTLVALWSPKQERFKHLWFLSLLPRRQKIQALVCPALNSPFFCYTVLPFYLSFFVHQ